MGVSECVDGNTGQQIEVAGAVGVPHIAAFAAHQDGLRRAEGVHDRMGVAVRPLLGVTHVSSPVALVVYSAVRMRVSTPGTTWVPTPSSVKISNSTAWGVRPSMTVARLTPSCTALRQAAILG